MSCLAQIEGANKPQSAEITKPPDVLVQLPDRPRQMSLEAIEEPSIAPIERRDELAYRLRQQSLLGEFGRMAMQTRDFGQILQRATELCAQGLQARFAKVLEF